MRWTDFSSEAWMFTAPRSCRLVLVDFLVRMWRLLACPRLIDPLARTLNRFAALFFVFIFGMICLLSSYMPPGVGRNCPIFDCPWHFFLLPTLLRPLGATEGDFARQSRAKSFLLPWRKHHHHLPPFEPGHRLDLAERIEIG